MSSAANYSVQAIRAIISSLDRSAALSSTLGSYTRRQDDWSFQCELDDAEISQIDRQLEGARLRQDVADYLLANLDLQIEQTTTVEEYLRSKYTNQQLYDWMLRQITTTYFQSYKLAFDMARRTKKSLRSCRPPGACACGTLFKQGQQPVRPTVDRRVVYTHAAFLAIISSRW